MNTLILGPRATLARDSRLHADRRATFHLRSAALHPVPWDAARRLLAGLHRTLGNAAVRAALRTERARLSLVLRGLVAELTPEERALRAATSFERLGRLPNMLPSSASLVEAWVGVLGALLPAGATLVVPDSACIDAESVSLLRPLVARAGAGLDLLVGHDPAHEPGDEAGMTWERVLWETRLLKALPGTCALDATADLSEATVAHAAPEPAPYDDDLEARAWRLLDRGIALGGDDLRTCLDATRAAYAAYGFPAASALADELLRRGTAGEAAPELEVIAGLSRYVTSYLRPEAEAAHEIEARLGPVLPHERDPEQRAHLLYRLSVLASRYRRDFAAGRDLAEHAIALARSGEIAEGRAPFFEAWGLNALALARFRGGTLADAIADCTLALARLDAVTDLPAAEVDLSRLVIADNLARLYVLHGDPESAARWQQVCETSAERLPDHRRPPMIWSYQNSASVYADAARAHFDRQLARAGRWLNPAMEATLAFMAGGCAYRVGDAAAALDHFEVARTRWQSLGDDPATVLGAAQNCAIAAFRARRYADAQRIFLAVLGDPLLDGEPGRFEVRAALGWVAAAAGDRAELDRQAVACAAAERDLPDDVRVRVRRSLAEAWLALGERERARDVLSVADLADVALAPEDEFGVLATRAALDPSDPWLLHRALVLAPQALEDVNAWWELPRLLPPLRDALEAGRIALDRPEVAAGLRAFLRAAAQREDCAPLVATLQALAA